jgi:hypothetical protein
MKKAILILVAGLLWCNVGVAAEIMGIQYEADEKALGIGRPEIVYECKEKKKATLDSGMEIYIPITNYYGFNKIILFNEPRWILHNFNFSKKKFDPATHITEFSKDGKRLKFSKVISEDKLQTFFMTVNNNSEKPFMKNPSLSIFTLNVLDEKIIFEAKDLKRVISNIISSENIEDFIIGINVLKKDLNKVLNKILESKTKEVINNTGTCVLTTEKMINFKKKLF